VLSNRLVLPPNLPREALEGKIIYLPGREGPQEDNEPATLSVSSPVSGSLSPCLSMRVSDSVVSQPQPVKSGADTAQNQKITKRASNNPKQKIVGRSKRKASKKSVIGKRRKTQFPTHKGESVILK